MTRCSRDDVNLIKLKSSVYNQTGENYHQQLNLHRSMCAHVRRIFSAKSVVDTRNPRYMRTMQRRCRPLSCRRKLLEPCLNNVIIDRLAYDTEHHPSQILKANQCRSKSNSKERSCSRDKQKAANDGTCPCARQNGPRDRPSTAKSTPKHRKRCEIDLSSCMGQTRRRDSDDADEPRMYDQRRTSSPCPSTRSRRCKFEANRQQQQQQRPCSSGAHDKRSCRNDDDDDEDDEEDDDDVDYPDDDNCCSENKKASRSRPVSSSQRRRRSSASGKDKACRDEEILMRKAAERGDDEARYAKFVYDITQEIVQNGLYTDDELRQVFNEHIERNSACLSKRRMLYEIYQLKISLNIGGDSCEEEDDMIFAENFVEHRVPKPPTPPKILNDNKVIEKLESFRMQDCPDRNGVSSPCCKNVMFVDANPEFLVTERDVLCTLMDNDVHPHQIQRIYRNLFQRSKDMSLCEAVQVGSEVAYTHRLKQVDKSSSMTSLCPKSPGILRRKSPEITPPQDLTHHRYDCIKSKQKEALEKCAKWNISEACGCKEQPCKHTKEFEPERKTKSVSSPQKHCNCEKSCERETEQTTQKIVRNRDRSVNKKSPDRKPKTPTKPARPPTSGKSTASQPKQPEKEVRAKSASKIKTTTIATPPRSVKKDLPSSKSRQKLQTSTSPSPNRDQPQVSTARSRSSSPSEEITRKSPSTPTKHRKIRRSVTPVESDLSESHSIEEEIEIEKRQRKSSSSSATSPKPRTPEKIITKMELPKPTPEFSDDNDDDEDGDGDKSVKEEIDADVKDDDDVDYDDDDQEKSPKSSAGFISMAKRRQSTYSIIPLPLFKEASPQKKIYHSGQGGLDGDELTIISSVLPSRIRTPEFTPEQGSDHTAPAHIKSSSMGQNRRPNITEGKNSNSRRSSHGPSSTRLAQPVDAREIRDALNELQRDSGAEDEMRDQLSLVLEEDESEDEEALTTLMDRNRPNDESKGQDSSSSDDDPSEQTGKHQQHRYPTVRDYMERFAAGEDVSPESWRQPSAASSDSTSSLDDELPTGERPVNGAAAALVNSSNDGSRRPMPTQRKRASSGFGGYQVMDTWNDNLSELPHEPTDPIQEESIDRSKKQLNDQRRRGR